MKALFGVIAILGTLLYVVMASLSFVPPVGDLRVRLYFDRIAWTLEHDNSPFPTLELSQLYPTARSLMSQLGVQPYVTVHELSTNTSLLSSRFRRVRPHIEEDWFSEDTLAAIEQELDSYRIQGTLTRRLPLKGVIIPYTLDFQSGLISLVEGRTFFRSEIRDGAPVALVSAEFAKKNGLGIGSHMNMMNSNRRFQQLEIIGIFSLHQTSSYADFYGLPAFQVAQYFVRQSALANRIYVPLALSHEVWEPFPDSFDLNRNGYGWAYEANASIYPMLEASFLLTSPSYREAFYAEAAQRLPAYWRLESPTAPLILIRNATIQHFLELMELLQILLIGLLFLMSIALISWKIAKGLWRITLVSLLGMGASFYLGALLTPLSQWLFKRMLVHEQTAYWDAFEWWFIPRDSFILDPIPYMISELEWSGISYWGFGATLFFILLVATLIPLIAHKRTRQDSTN